MVAQGCESSVMAAELAARVEIESSGTIALDATGPLCE